MAETASTMLALSTRAPVFDLPNYNKSAGVPRVAITDFQDRPLIVAFICNHCPFVVLIKDRFAQLADQWQESGVSVVAINSNDVAHYPADSPEKMTAFASSAKFNFPYLYDETQAVAKAYQAACTPDFYLFDKAHHLAYRGQFDSARPGNAIQVTGEDLDRAVKAVLEGKPPQEVQTPSVGCNIKWQDDNAPEYY